MIYSTRPLHRNIFFISLNCVDQTFVINILCRSEIYKRQSAVHVFNIP